MADVFLSYKREERVQVERLANALRGLGLTVWFDASLAAGDAFSDEIDREVRSARVVVACWSPLAAASQWVKAEALIGFSKQNLISAYVVGPDDFEPPVPFSSLHMEDMRAWALRPSARDPAWLSVLRGVGSLVDRTDIADWGALGPDASASQIEAWLAAHAATSPLVIDAESFLQQREAASRERAAAEIAARERIERMRLEKAAAEQAVRDEQNRDHAERRIREAEQRAATAKRTASRTRRVLVVGGGIALVGGGAWAGLLSEQPFLRNTFPTADLASAATFRLRPRLRLKCNATVTHLAFSPDGARLITQFVPYDSSPQQNPQLWDTASGRLIATLSGTRPIFNADGTRLVTTDADLRLWDGVSGSQIAELPARAYHADAIFSPDGKRVVISASATREATVWDAASGQEIATLDGGHDIQGMEFGINAVAFSPDSSHLATAGGALSVWNTRSWAKLSTPARGQYSYRSVEFSPDGRRIVTSSSDTQTWDIAGGAVIPARSRNGFSESAAFSPDGARIVMLIGSDIEVWDAGLEQNIAKITNIGADQVAFSPDGNLIIARLYRYKLFDQRTGKMFGPRSDLRGAPSFSPDGAQVIFATPGSSTAQLWSTASGHELAVLRGHGTYVSSAAFSPDGKSIVTGAADGAALIWDIE